jgi:adenylate cyclase
VDDDPLLDGLEGDARDERRALLDWLRAKGFSEEDLARATREGLVAFLAAERVVMQGPPALSLREAAERAGVEVEVLGELRRAMGLPVPDPDEVTLSEAEADEVGRFLTLGLSLEQVLPVARVLGRGLAHSAQAMRAVTMELILAPGLSERDVAARYEVAVEALMPHVGPMVEQVLRLHLRNMVRTEAIEVEERLHGVMPGARDVGVAFGDLVGFTRMGEEVAPERVGFVADRLADLAAGVVQAPVRVVKTIGDAVMLVSEDPAALVAAGLDLVEAVDAEGAEFPQVRVGVASGRAVLRGGDWYGRPVNLASRITQLARAGSVLVAEEAQRDGFTWSFAGSRRIKGVPEPVKLFRARRAD